MNVNRVALSASRVSLSAVAVAVALGGAASCYNPSFTNGGFKCSSTYKEEGPGGYACHADHLCWLIGTHPDVDASADQVTDKVEAPVDAPAADATIESKPDALVCIVPPMNCTPAGGAGCAPMCQRGGLRGDRKRRRLNSRQ